MLYICQDREDWTCPYIWHLAAIVGIFLQVEYMFAWSGDHFLCNSSTDVLTDSQLQYIQCEQQESQYIIHQFLTLTWSHVVYGRADLWLPVLADLRSYQKHQSRLSHTAVHSGKCHPLTTSLPHHLCTLKLSLNSKHQDISNYTTVSCLWEVNALLNAVHILMCWTQGRRINVNPILTPGSTEVYGYLHKGLPVGSILSHINTIHSLTSYFFKCHFNITL